MQYITLTNCMRGPFDLPVDLFLDPVKSAEAMDAQAWGRRASLLNTFQSKGLRLYPNSYIEVPKMNFERYSKVSRAFKGMLDEGLLKVGAKKHQVHIDKLKNSSRAKAPDHLYGNSKVEGFDFEPIKKGGENMGIVGVEIDKGKRPIPVTVNTTEVTNDY